MKQVSLEECLKNADVKIYVCERGVNFVTGEDSRLFYITAYSDMNEEVAESKGDLPLLDVFNLLKEIGVRNFEVSPAYRGVTDEE